MEPTITIDDCGCKHYKIGWDYHRADGPAFICCDGTKYWYINNLLHRLDGPAAEYSYGYKEWFVSGKRLDCRTQSEFEQYIRLKAFH